MSLPFSRFLEIVLLLKEVRAEEAKAELINSAFTAFQMGAGGDMTFKQYIEKLGLSDSPTVARVEISAKDAIQKADAIMRQTGSKQ